MQRLTQMRRPTRQPPSNSPEFFHGVGVHHFPFHYLGAIFHLCYFNAPNFPITAMSTSFVTAPRVSGKS